LAHALLWPRIKKIPSQAQLAPGLELKDLIEGRVPLQQNVSQDEIQV